MTFMNLFGLTLRYSYSRYNRHLAASIKIALTYAVSITAMIVVMAIMSSLQASRFSSIRDVKSFDITVEDGDREKIAALYPDQSVFEYREGYAMLNGIPLIIRYIGSDYDGAVIPFFGNAESLMISYSTYLSTSGDIRLSYISYENGMRRIVNEEVPISGVFYTSLGSDFDSFYAFMPIESAPDDAVSYVAVKGSDDVSPLLENGISGFETWKEKESTLYSAFMLESVMMALVLLVLLLISYLALRQEARIFLKNKVKERAELRIAGLEGWKIKLVFVSSFLVSLILGSFLSLFISEILVRVFSAFMRSYLGYYGDIAIDYTLFIALNAVFFFITAVTVLFFLRMDDKKSIREALDGR